MNLQLKQLLRDDCRESCVGFDNNLNGLRNQAILVTGGTGFMGAWIAEVVCYLNEEHKFGTKLYLLSRDSKGFIAKIPHIANQPFVHFIESDTRNISVLPDDISLVIHAAGTPDNREHASQPLRVIDVSYRGTVALLEACLRLPALKKVVYVSSNYVYGQQSLEVRIKESQMGVLDCNSVNSAYGEAKRIGETICAVYRNQQQLPITIVRPFAFIGPYQGLEKPWAVNNFIRDSILGGPIRILGDKDTVRSYLYGSDMAYWILSALASEQAGQSYNIGSDAGLTLYDLAQKVTQCFPKRIDIAVKTSVFKTSISQSSVPDTMAIEKDLGVKRRINIDSALTKTVRWYQEWIV